MSFPAAFPLTPIQPRRTRLSEDERRCQLIDAAETVFLDKGFHAATMDDIARQAGMSKKTLYQIFPAKSALFEALILARIAGFTMVVEDDDRSPRDVLTDLLCRVVTQTMTEKQVALLRLMIAESPRSPEIAEALDRLHREHGKGVLEKWMVARVADGTFRIDNVRETATMLFWTAAGDFLMQRLLSKPVAVTEEEVTRRVEQTVEAFFREMDERTACS